MNLLMHVCCAPCLVHVNDFLTSENISYQGFFYNPNIHPYLEYKRRMKTLENYSKAINKNIIFKESFMQKKWEENKNNCDFCYEKRIFETAKTAKEEGFSHFSTTLLISPYQNHERIIGISEKAEKLFDVKFYYKDFRTGFRQGQDKARELNLYRQKYCGCINSYDNSKFKDKIKW